MSKNDSPNVAATLSKESPSRPGRAVREDDQYDQGTVTQSNPPNHGKPTHGVGRFLVELDPDTLGGNWIETLPQRFKRWQNGGDPNQLPLTEVASNE